MNFEIIKYFINITLIIINNCFSKDYFGELNLFSFDLN